MFRKIASKIPMAQWVSAPTASAPLGSRWWRLEVYDRLLDGTFYDHLPYAFYDEQDGAGNPVKLENRRPSAQLRLPRYLARWAARKLFAGRHIPKVRSANAADEARVQDLLTGTHIWPTMKEAAYRGAVGSVAITFCVGEGEGADRKVGFKVWRALWAMPTFDDFGELIRLRVHYVTNAAALEAIGLAVPKPDRQYWFIRDYTPTAEVTYVPPEAGDWNPVEGGKEPLVPATTVEHGLGFVPGVWIKNPYGAGEPDGQALFEDVIPNTVEVDYLLSQSARGARYNCAPQLVTVGEVKNLGADGLDRGPTTYLAFDATHKDQQSGEMLGAGDAKLLEMTGTGAEAALKVVEILKKFALEQAGVIQKDPGEMPGPLSGRAMEYLDEDAHDTAMDWRSTYGDGGALPLIAKVLQVLAPDLDTSKLWLQWPRIYQPTPADLQSIAQALMIVAAPQAVPGAAAGEDGGVPTLAPLLDRETASAYLKANLDLGILDDTVGESVAGPEGGVPAPDPEGAQGPVAGAFGPFWRVVPPTKVK